MNNIFVLDKNYNKIGTLSNQGVKPLAPYYNDLFVQELETGADTYEFSTISNSYTQDCIEIGNHIMFAYKNRNELFTITSLEYSHSEGYKTIGVYAEGLGFELLEIYMKKPKETESDDDDDSSNKDDGNTYLSDKIYIDKNGNIIYDKDGNPSNNGGDVTIDENGNIIYKPSKNNKENDSLEFKNISYPTFLNVLLKNTGWSFVCQPGLESIKHDITVKYDTNIYAILQDSMQSYRGVELEFVFEYNNGNIKKTVKAYKDGGRGSFVGKRFEYGTNVKGITKTQEVTNSEDDTILYVDNVGVDVRYDVDFALKSAEVPEIEIGDTHYVIDKDFYPPMTIKARIGKIEVSFSDPTRNKIYLANNKKIRGSAIEEGVNEDDIKDIMDDYDGDIGEHTHSYLEHYIYQVHLNGKEFTGANRFYNLGSETFPWWYIFTRAMRAYSDITSPRYFGYNYQVFFDREDMEDVVKITNSSNVTKQDLLNFIVNDLNVYEYSAREVNESVNENVDDPNARFPNQLYFGLLSEDVVNHGNPCKTSAVGKRISKGLVQSDTNNDGDGNDNDTHNAHTYNIPALLAALIGAFQYYVSGGKPTGSNPKDEDYDYTGNPSAPSDPDDPGTGGGTPSNPGTGGDGTFGDIIVNSLRIYSPEDDNYVPVRLTNAGIGADIIVADSEVGTPRLLVSDAYPDDASVTIPPEIVVTRRNSAELKITPDGITFPDGTTLTTANGSGGGTLSGIPIEYIQQDENHVYEELGNSWVQINDDVDINGALYVGGCIVGAAEIRNVIVMQCHTATIHRLLFPDGSELTSAKDLAGSGGGGSASGNTFDTITVTKIQGPDRGENQLKIVEFEDAIRVSCISGPEDVEVVEFGNDTFVCMHAGLNIDGGDVNVDGNIYANNFPSSDISLKENIRYIDAASATNDLEKTDLYDFIVNQLNICEYNFIGKDDDKIGFIANEYEGTKVGDKIVSRNKKTNLLAYDISNLLFATIGALQEEVRIKDEKIASLEDRLARIEAMLGINNDN